MSGHSHVCEGELLQAPVVAVIGLGLIGASFAAALKASGAAGHVIGHNIRAASSEWCLAQGYIDSIAASAAEAAARADVIVLAVPPLALAETMRAMAPSLREGAVVTDVASVKEAAMDAIAPLVPEGVDFVPAHPIAGSAQSGAQAANPALFHDKLVVLTADETRTKPRAIAAVARLWEAVGARTERMSAKNHDVIYAHVSHIPQLLAYAACRVLARQPQLGEDTAEFRRFIRLGGSSAALWTEIFSANAVYVSYALKHVLAILSHMLDEFEQGEQAGNVSFEYAPEAASRHFPMLVGAVLVSVVTQFEIQNHTRLAPYAGTGFRDVIAFTEHDPEQDMEAISKNFKPVAALLSAFREELIGLQTAICDVSTAREEGIKTLLERCHADFLVIEKKLSQQKDIA